MRLEAEVNQLTRQLTNAPKTEEEKANEFSEAYKQASFKKKNGGLAPQQQISELSAMNKTAQMRYNKQGGAPKGTI